jgi:hypothetical protein
MMTAKQLVTHQFLPYWDPLSEITILFSVTSVVSVAKDFTTELTERTDSKMQYIIRA